ncbi:hypothetical protein [Massilia sp. TN1-12]|uniref:hypothetical protein n=1 Tax=Massilia paldalensis TaxID=3377675 RepID=UPI00384AAC1A
MTRVSIPDYVAQCDEDQLHNLVSQANRRIDEIKKTGWVRLWTLNVSWANLAWFAEDDYEAAVEHVAELVKKSAMKHPNTDIEITMTRERYRPDEVERLLSYTPKKEKKS